MCVWDFDFGGAGVFNRYRGCELLILTQEYCSGYRVGLCCHNGMEKPGGEAALHHQVRNVVCAAKLGSECNGLCSPARSAMVFAWRSVSVIVRETFCPTAKDIVLVSLQGKEIRALNFPCKVRDTFVPSHIETLDMSQRSKERNHRRFQDACRRGV